MGKVRDFFRVIAEDADLGELGSEQHNTFVLFWGGLFLSVISLVLTVFNVIMGYWLMANTTMCLIVGFAVACVIARFRRFGAARVLMALLCALFFSLYAATGQNDGFAILWILLIPILSMMLLGLRTGFLLSLYFQVFLVVLFYTPVSACVDDYYTSTFIARFPVLYFTSFAVVTFLMCQRQRLYIEANKQATHDGLTGLLNRHSAQEAAAEVDDAAEHPELSVVALDINRLKWVNDNLGHQAGDELIQGAADVLRAAFPADKCFRMGGDEFLVISERTSVEENVSALRAAQKAWRGKSGAELVFSIGVASRADAPEATYDELSKAADDRMYEDKAAFYLSNNIDRRTR